MKRPRTSVLAAATVLLLTACGGPTGQLEEVRTYHPNGMVASVGHIDPSTGLQTGAWEYYFDNGQMRWRGVYKLGTVDTTRHWREWNRNGSTRDDQTDF